MAITTKKEFKAVVQEHIINTVLSEEHGETIQEQLQAVIDEFGSWYSPYERKANPNYYNAFRHWFLGLPSCFNVQYEYYTIHQTLKGWFESTGATYKERREDQEADTYYHLVTREFEVLCKKNGVAPIYTV